jgi:hypothetical protein
MTMFSKAAASLLITGTTSAPPLTGSVPPLMKQFCTSTTIRALLASGLIVPAANSGRATPSPPTRASAVVDFKRSLRDNPCVTTLMVNPPGSKSGGIGRQMKLSPYPERLSTRSCIGGDYTAPGIDSVPVMPPTDDTENHRAKGLSRNASDLPSSA